MVPRRALIVGVAAGLLRSPLAAAQPGDEKPRIGFLSPSAPSPISEGFRRGLRDQRYVEGQTIVVEYRWAEGRFDRLPDLAAELVREDVDVIVA